MPRLRNSLPKYRKHKASGQAIVTISGSGVYLGPHNTDISRMEYDRVVSEWLAAGRPQHSTSTQRIITVGEVMVTYMQFAQMRYVKNGRATSEQDGIRAALRFVRELYSGHPATDFGPLALKAVRQKMIDRDLARTTINQNTSRIKRMFRRAVSEELIPASVYQALQTVSDLRKNESQARETDRIGPVEVSVVEATLECLNQTVADMVQIQLLTGMRPGEVTQIRPCDLDRTDDVWIYTPESHKTEHHGRTRQIGIGPQGQVILSPYMERDPESYCFCSRKSGESKYLVSSYRTAIRRACIRAKVEVWKPNQLRHTFATQIRHQHTRGMEAAQAVLGHASIETTQVYAERDRSLITEVARMFG